MAKKGAGKIAFASFGLLALDVAAIAAEAEITPQSVGANSVTFRVIRVPAGVASIKIGYRILKRRNVEAFSFSSAITTPAIDDTVQITGLTANTLYECMTFGYDDAGNFSYPGNVLPVITMSLTTEMRDVLKGFQTLFLAEMNSELLTVGAARGEIYEPFKTAAILDVIDEYEVQYNPLMMMVGPEADPTEEIGVRKFWNYTVNLVIRYLSKKGDIRQQQREISAYVQAAENILLANQTLGSDVWEVSVIGKQYPPLLDEDNTRVSFDGILLCEVWQTN